MTLQELDSNPLELQRTCIRLSKSFRTYFFLSHFFASSSQNDRVDDIDLLLRAGYRIYDIQHRRMFHLHFRIWLSPAYLASIINSYALFVQGQWSYAFHLNTKWCSASFHHHSIWSGFLCRHVALFSEKDIESHRWLPPPHAPYGLVFMGCWCAVNINLCIWLCINIHDRVVMNCFMFQRRSVNRDMMSFTIFDRIGTEDSHRVSYCLW